MRIVEYDYRPEFASRMGIDHLHQTGTLSTEQVHTQTGCHSNRCSLQQTDTLHCATPFPRKELRSLNGLLELQIS
jgi:hypothetical protein